MKTKHIQIRTTEERHVMANKTAQERGMTISGMIRYAVKKIFGIDL